MWHQDITRADQFEPDGTHPPMVLWPANIQVRYRRPWQLLDRQKVRGGHSRQSHPHRPTRILTSPAVVGVDTAASATDDTTGPGDNNEADETVAQPPATVPLKRGPRYRGRHRKPWSMPRPTPTSPA